MAKHFCTYRKIPPVSFLLLSLCAMQSWAEDAPQNKTSEDVTTLKTIQVSASAKKAIDKDLSAIPKTIITREEMLKYGDQSVTDALRRAAGFQIPSSGQGPRGNGAASGMRFRGGSAPVFLINGEPVQGGPRGGMSIVDTITTDMIERIEVVKQPSVAQGSVASSAVINIILKEPLDTLLNGNLRVGYGDIAASDQQESRRQVSLQADGKDQAWTYSLSANQMWIDTTSTSTTTNSQGTREQTVDTDRTMRMFAPRVEYSLDDEQKLVAEVFYRDTKSKNVSSSQYQNDDNDSVRLNTRYERKTDNGSDKLRLSAEHQNETQLTTSNHRETYTDETINEYAFAYDGVRKFDDHKELKFGFDTRTSSLESNLTDTLDEDRYALYAEGSLRMTERQTITLGARQEWIQRSGLVDYQDHNLSPVLAHRFEFDDHWSLQSNLSKSVRNPRAESLVPTITISNDSDAGSLNNPDKGGNPDLRPEKISAFESTLEYNAPNGGMSLTGYYRNIKDYIENVIALEGSRYVQRPENQDKAVTYGVELTGRYALKETGSGHSFMLNAQLSTVHATVDDGTQERLASDVAPYTASSGISYNYKPMHVSTSFNLSYTPKFTRGLASQLYDRTTNARVGLDFSTTKTFNHGWGLTFSARNLLGTRYKEYLTNQSDGSMYETRMTKSIPSYLLTLEKKF